MSDKKLTQIFFKRLTVIVILTLSITTALAWTAQTHQSDNNTDLLMNNIIQYIFASIDQIDHINAHSGFNLTHEKLSEFYGQNIPVIKNGGMLIVLDGMIVGESGIFNEFNQTNTTNTSFIHSDSLSPNTPGYPIDSVGISNEDLWGDSGHFILRIKDQKYQCYYETRDEMTVVSALPNSIAYAVRNTSIMYIFIGHLLLFSTLYFGIYLLLRRFVLSGVQNINRSLEKITNGNLNEKISVYDNYEFSQLSDGINTMVSSLKEMIEKESKRIDAELKYARQIQSASLPKLSSLPIDNRFLIAADMIPAKEVGGDFYDFFMTDENHLCAIVADVSGKGIPAALYMMSVKDKIRAAVLSEKNIEDAFFAVNNQLCESDSDMFVTCLVCVFDLNSGQTTVLNAGHNAPLIYQKNENEKDMKTFEFISCPPNFILAGLKNKKYQKCEFLLDKGDIFFMYTDGVTECMNPDFDLFGEERLKSVLNKSDKTPKILISSINAELKTFSNGSEPSDDVTLLVFQRQ